MKEEVAAKEAPNDEAEDSSPASFEDGAWVRHSTSIVGGLAVYAVLTGTVVYWLLEDWGWVNWFYFAVITLTTVGYGDFSPTTTASKLFTVGYVISGIALIGASLNEVLKRRERRTARRRSKVTGRIEENRRRSEAGGGHQRDRSASK